MRDSIRLVRVGTGWIRSGAWVGLAIAVIVGLAACSESPSSEEAAAPRFVTTIPPFEMILRPVVKGRGVVDRLVEPGASPHTYDPTPSDLRAASNATALVYGAEHLDGWLANLSGQRRIALLDFVPPNGRLQFESDGHGSESQTVDPHFWTDPQAVIGLLPPLTDTLCAIDARGCSTYRANADSFATVLSALDARLHTMMQPVRDTPVLLAQPFFRYFLHRYGPRLVGIVEPRPGTEPTPRQLLAITDAARTSGARFILTQQSLSDRTAAAVGDVSSLPLVALDPLGGTEAGTSYAELLLFNAQILGDALRRPE